ncbi:MAG: carboxypeptidase regulatory-like domain-containing protein [Deltaproteobacteria bacterium]|nr:carboxypeptidase regulatory-like domain-containing protein [Deltaproteobacteria bacterium]
MRRWGATCLCMLVAASALAQPATAEVSATADVEVAGPLLQLGYGALPGGIHAASALTLPAGTFAVATLGGFGWRSGLLPDQGGNKHRFGRGVGNLAFAYAPTDLFTIALTLDGRYDRHFGVPRTTDGKKEDGYVGDPRLIVRAGKPMGSLTIGGQLGVWVPGKDAPSVAGSAISVEARGLLSLQAGPGTLSFNAGFRLDNSAKSVEEPERLSVADRISLGVSEFHAVVGGAHITVPAGKAFVGAEGSIDFFIGDGAPGPLLRGGVHGGLHLTDQWSLLAFVEVAKVPGIEATEVMMNYVPLIAYEPAITGGIGLQGRFGGTRRLASDDHITKNVNPADVEVIEYADVTGTITDEAGKPVVGARVTIKLKNHSGTGATDDKGNYTVPRLPIGKTVAGTTNLDDTIGELAVEVEGKKPATQTLTLVKGPNTVAKLALEPLLPPGQLRAVLRAAGTGKPIPGGIVTIEPSGATATAAADGTVSIDLPPGTYKAKATAPGFKEQTLDVVIDPNGVAVKNFELRK